MIGDEWKFRSYPVRIFLKPSWSTSFGYVSEAIGIARASQRVVRLETEKISSRNGVPFFLF